MNSMPASFNVFSSLEIVSVCTAGISSEASTLKTVRNPTSDCRANSFADQPRAALAVLICRPVIIDKILFGIFNARYGINKS